MQMKANSVIILLVASYSFYRPLDLLNPLRLYTLKPCLSPDSGEAQANSLKLDELNLLEYGYSYHSRKKKVEKET